MLNNKPPPQQWGGGFHLYDLGCRPPTSEADSSNFTRGLTCFQVDLIACHGLAPLFAERLWAKLPFFDLPPRIQPLILLLHEASSQHSVRLFFSVLKIKITRLSISERRYESCYP